MKPGMRLRIEGGADSGRRRPGNDRLWVFVVLAMAAFAPSEVSAQDSGQDAFRPLTQAMLNDPDPADWLMWRGG